MDQVKFLRGNMLGSCGPSSAESMSQGAQQSLAQEMQANYATRFADQQQVLDRLNQSLSPIVAAGPNQQGFSPEELANLNTQAINTTGAAARNATQATQTSLAGRGGGGDSGLVSGIDRQIQGSIASSEAGNLADTQNKITAADYATGRQNYETGLKILGGGPNSVAGLYDPAAFGGLASKTNESSFNEADKISQEQNAKSAAIWGSLSSLAKSGLSFATGGISNVMAGGANAGSGNSGGIGNFFSGGFDALAGG
jgi:hypothetical protein